MLSVNKDYIAASTNTDQYFGMQLGYDKNASLGTFAPQYNGNISGTIWKSEGDQQKRKYDFTYDAANRITNGNFTQYVTGSGAAATFNITDGIDFTLSGMTYDANGNIITMNQKGLKLNTSSTIDQLTYSYLPNSNKLSKVTDAVTAVDNGKLGDFKDATNGAPNDYDYDLNGNLTIDNNKSISSITYNHLNLPLAITVTGKGTITYTYDAAGNTQKKTTTETGATVPYNGTDYTAVTITTTTTYLGAAVYETKAYSNPALAALQYTDKLQFMVHEEGRIRAVYNNSASPNTITALAYDYMLKDHLGNVRMVLTEEVKQDAYPVATLEGPLPNATTTAASLAYIEKDYYTIDNTYVVAAPPAMTGSPNAPYQNNFLGNNNNSNCTGSLCTTANSANAYKLNANTNKTGLGITLKVMAGDYVNVSVKSYHKKPSVFSNYTDPIAPLSLAQVLNAFTLSGIISGKGLSGTLNAANTAPPSLNSFFTNQPNQTSSVLKAFINYIVFDEQFKYVTSGFQQVGGSNILTSHLLSIFL